MSWRLRAVPIVPAAIAAALALPLGACKLGPDFFSPAAPEVSGYTEQHEKNLPSVESQKRAPQRLAIGAKVEADWWVLFRSPALDQVMKQALADSPTIAQAQAALVQAREQANATAGGLLPQFDATAGVARQRVNARINGNNRISVPVNVYSLGPSVSYDFDIFGGREREVEAQLARADVSQYQLAAAYLSLTGNIATQAIQIASVRAEIKAVERIIADDTKNLQLVRAAQAAGTATAVDVTTAQSQLAVDRALLPPLRQQLSIARHALAVYAGKSPAEWSPPDFDLSGLTLPKDLPVSLPSELVRNRPDILAAEAQLHVASAEIGVATANLYPKFTLTGLITQAAPQVGNVFAGIASGWNVTAGLAAPIFHGGTLQAQQRASLAAYDAAWSGYRYTVLQSLGQVADVLQALAHDEEAVVAQTRALATADEALRLARLSYTEGNSNLLQVFDAQLLADRALIGAVRAQARRVADTAQLFVALGSGWWNTPPTPPQSPAPKTAAR